MTHFHDLTPYEYSQEFGSEQTYNIGWLDNSHPFERLRALESDIVLVSKICWAPVAKSRGVHFCSLCSEEKWTVEEWEGKKWVLGEAEIRVFSNCGKVYAAPNMLLHYMKAHDYCPPEEFLLALRECPLPPNEEYFARLKSLGLVHAEPLELVSEPRKF